MAGDWIKMRVNLIDDPAVIGMASRLGIDEYAVVGRLQALWSWADSQSRDGHATGVTKEWVNRKVQCDGFAEAMDSVNWLRIEADGLEFPNFGNHNGETAKTRALGKNRKQKQRSSDFCPDSVTQDVPKASRTQRDKSETREEKSLKAPLIPKTASKKSTTFTAWIDAVPDGEEAIPANHHVFAYAKRVGIPAEFLALAWTWFERRYSSVAKRYSDWPKVFRNAVEGNWGKLWWIDGDGAYKLTTAGTQLQREVGAAQ